MKEKKKGGRKGCKLIAGLLLASALSCSAESFYKSYVNVSTNAASYTNLGVNAVMVSSIMSQSEIKNSNDVYVVHVRGSNTSLVYTVAMSNHTSFYLTKSDLQGLWLIKDDILGVSNGAPLGQVTNRITINMEESR